MDAIDSFWPHRRALALVSAIAALTAASPARAEGVEEGAVIALDAGDLVLDLGALRGAAEGDLVELWRPLKLRHPLTGRTLSERFRIGSLRLKQVRPAMALATPEGTPDRPPLAGDVVVLRKASKSPAGTPPKGPAPGPGTPDPGSPGAPTGSPEATPQDPETEALTKMLLELQGSAPETRAERYEAFVLRWPLGKTTRVLREEAYLLRTLVKQTAQGAPGGAQGASKKEVLFHPPTAVIAGRALELALKLPDPQARAVLHLRGAGETTYSSRPMEPAGTGYHRARIEEEAMKSPEIFYFIEAVGADGQASAVVGSAQQPRRLAVLDPAPTAILGRGPVTAAFWVDYANFNRLRSNDYLVQTEGYFGVRLGDDRIRAVRSGFGVLRGRGGTLRELDELGLQGRSVGLTYGYLEGEFAASPTLSFVGRLVLGLRRDGVGSGGQGFVRFGSDLRTNLLLGGEVLGGVGIRGITQLEWRTIPRVPVVLRTEVTNQPAGEVGSTPNLVNGLPTESTGKGEVGLRAIVQAGYELTPSLTLSARASYQGRTINHAGPGFGAAVSYQW